VPIVAVSICSNRAALTSRQREPLSSLCSGALSASTVLVSAFHTPLRHHAITAHFLGDSHSIFSHCGAASPEIQAVTKSKTFGCAGTGLAKA
jgi:hypothetical protein